MLDLATIATIPPPSVHNLTLGPLTLHLYGLIIGIAIVVSMWLAERMLIAQGVDVTHAMRVIVPSVAAGFVGARLYHVLSEPVRYWNDPIAAFEVWNGGLGIYGAVAAGGVVAMWLCPRNGIPRMAMCDAAAVAVPAAQAIGRWGNYVNQELFGRPTSAAWGLEVEQRYRPVQYAAECCFHPVFLYESLACAVISITAALLVTRWRTRPPGILFPLYVAAYAGFRFINEGLRVDAAHEYLGLRQNEWVSLALVVGALAVAAWMWRRHEPPVPAPPSVDRLV